MAAPFDLGRIEFGMYQFPFPGFPSLGVQPRNLLPAGMGITPYNHHAKTLFFPASLSSNTRLPGRIEPSFLSIFIVFAKVGAYRGAAAWRITSMRRLNVAVDFAVECRK